METTTNTGSRKKQPSGSCAECGTAILKRKRHCPKCAERAAERAQRAKDGYVAIQTVTGPVEVRLPKIGVSKSVVFDTYDRRACENWTEKTRCGELIDVLLRILHASPPYLTPRDARRHMALLYHLKNYRTTVWEWNKPEKEFAVEDMPLRELNRALSSWVRSWFQGPHALVSCYALDVAELIHAHAFGLYKYTDQRDAWKITPLLPSGLIKELDGRSHFSDGPSFKRDMTSAISGILAVVKVPPRGRCVGHPPNNEVLLDAGDEFIIEIVRCHLSSSFYDWTAMTAIDDDEPEFSLSRQFEIPCELRGRHLGGDGPFELRDKPYHSLQLKIPGRWLTHVLTHKEWRDPWVTTPLPEWIFG
ncbi:MAG: hypothetical protein JNL82_04380 [Myxococcales bacterium]|nr:hypothetical protein [Myxococcales bacterium]